MTPCFYNNYYKVTPVTPVTPIFTFFYFFLILALYSVTCNFKQKKAAREPRFLKLEAQFRYTYRRRDPWFLSLDIYHTLRCLILTKH